MVLYHNPGIEHAALRFLHGLEKKGDSEPFRSNDNMNRYRYLPQKPTSSNPTDYQSDSLKIPTKAILYRSDMRCLSYRPDKLSGKSIRIDGGPAGADMETFMADMVRALKKRWKMTVRVSDS